MNGCGRGPRGRAQAGRRSRRRRFIPRRYRAGGSIRGPSAFSSGFRRRSAGIVGTPGDRLGHPEGGRSIAHPQRSRVVSSRKSLGRRGRLRRCPPDTRQSVDRSGTRPSSRGPSRGRGPESQKPVGAVAMPARVGGGPQRRVDHGGALEVTASQAVGRRTPSAGSRPARRWSSASRAAARAALESAAIGGEENQPQRRAGSVFEAKLGEWACPRGVSEKSSQCPACAGGSSIRIWDPVLQPEVFCVRRSSLTHSPPPRRRAAPRWNDQAASVSRARVSRLISGEGMPGRSS